MAIANNNVQNVKFLRNGSVYKTHALALNALKSFQITAEQDGTAILARYTSTEDEQTVVKTLVGWIYSGETGSYITIQDVEGASGDVEALEKEIKDILGNGVSSGEGKTVSEQLAALSGGTYTPGTSSSAGTSVEGAKAYAKDYTDAEIDKLSYTGVTTGTGVYVTNVTEADGIISATTATLPTVVDTAEAKKFVIAVDETLGKISVSRGTISSSAETIVLTDNTDDGVNFEVNIDNETIVQDATSKKLKVASAALTQYVGDEKTIHISDADAQNNKTVSTLLTISATTASEANVKEQYNLVNASGETIGATIKIYKDSALLSVALLHADTTANPQVLPTYDKATNTWTDIASQTAANQALCYAYEDVSGNTVVAAVPVGSFINEQEFASGITWDATEGKVRGVVDPQSEKNSNNVDFLTVGANGFKISGIKDEIDGIVEGLDATVTGATSGNHVTISIEEVDGKLVQSGLTIEENDIASASDLAELSGKTITEVASENNSITATLSAATDGTKHLDIVTDASKIKMTGFTADEGGFTGITSASTVSEAVKTIETEILDNEQTTSAALNDLNSRINSISGNSISGVSVNGKAVTVADNVAPISITAATSATTATSTEAITVDTDANGNITLGLATIDCGFYA